MPASWSLPGEMAAQIATSTAPDFPLHIYSTADHRLNKCDICRTSSSPLLLPLPSDALGAGKGPVEKTRNGGPLPKLHPHPLCRPNLLRFLGATQSNLLPFPFLGWPLAATGSTGTLTPLYRRSAPDCGLLEVKLWSVKTIRAASSTGLNIQQRGQG